MVERLKGMFKELKVLIKLRRLADSEGQSKRIWDRSQILSSERSGQKGKSFRFNL